MSGTRAAMKKILVVEDEASIRLNLALMLKGEGYEVDSAENGRAGIEHAKSFGPDLIVSDVMMPVLDGFGMLEALRADPRYADTPFIFLTALNDRGSMRRDMNLGADDFLNKPFTRDELIDAVNSRLKKYESAARSLAQRLVAGNDELRRWYRQNLSGAESERPLAIAETAGMTGKMTVATVLFADIRNFTTYSEPHRGADRGVAQRLFRVRVPADRAQWRTHRQADWRRHYGGV